MKIVVLTKLIPDLVEELTIDESGASLDRTWMRLILNEFDHHAIEQAILLKETIGGEVIVIAPDVEDADEVLFTAAASGADRLIKLCGLRDLADNHALGGACVSLLQELQPDLILTGVQAHDDIDGQVGAILAEYLHLPYVGCIAGLSIENGLGLAYKEFPGGLTAEINIQLPAVVGIQAAQSPPRYVAFSRIRQARSSAVIEEVRVEVLESAGKPLIGRLSQPETGTRAEMLSGNPEEVAAKIMNILREKDIL